MDFMHMHVESHFEASDTVRDIVIGMADGLTVPFALAAGLTGTVAATSKLVVIAGLAEIAAGSIAMGLGGYLAARTDRDHYESERARELRETIELPQKVASAAVLAAIVVAALGLRYVGLPLAPSDQPLQFGKSYEVGGPNLLARVAGDPGSDEFDFAYAPGAEIRSGITLQNTGGLPLSVTGRPCSGV